MGSVLRSISNTLDPHSLSAALSAKADIGSFMASIGSTSTTNSDPIIVSEDDIETDDEGFNVQNRASLIGQLDFDSLMASVYAGTQHGVSPEHLSKIWRILLQQANNNLEVTSQKQRRTENPTLLRNYATNDRMVQYKRIREFFFTDTFFVA